MTLEELKVVISATIQPLKEAMNKAKAEVKNATGEMGRQVEKTKKSFFSGFGKGKISPTIDTSGLEDKILDKTNEADMIDKKIEITRRELQKLKEEFSSTFNSDSRNKLEKKIVNTENSLNHLVSRSIKLRSEIDTLRAKLDGAGDSANNASKGVNNLGNKSNNAKNKLSSLNGALNKLGIGNKKTKSGMDNLMSTMKKYARMIVINRLLIASLVKGIRSLLSSMVATLKTNSQFSNSLAQIQTNLRVAFTPIYQAILPAINTLMSALSKLTGYIASFTSAIFGKTYAESKAATQSLIDAKAAMGAYGDTTEKTKKAVDRLAGIDEINKLSSNNDSDNDKSNVPVLADVDTSAFDGKMEKLAKKMKEIFKTIFQPFKNAWKKDGSWVTDKFNLAVENTKKSLSGFYESLKNPVVQKFIENIAGIGIALGGLALSIYNNFIIPVVNWFISLLPSAAEGLNPLLEKIKEFIKNLADSPEKVQKLCSAVLGIVVAIGTLKIIVQVAKWVKNLQGVIALLTTNPITIVIIALAELVAAFVAFYASNEEFRDKMQGVWEGLWSSIKPVLDNIGKILKWLLDEILAPLAEWTISDLLPSFFNLVSGALDVLNPILEAFMEAGKWLWDSFLKPIAEWTGGVVVDILNGLADVLKVIGEWVKEHQETITKILKVLGVCLTVFAAIKIALGAIAVVIGILTSPITLVIAAITALVAIFIQLYDSCEGFRKFIDTVVEFGKNLILGLLEGIASIMSKIGTWLKDHIVDPILNGIKKLFGIHSPSTVMAEIGIYLMEGLLSGILSLKDKIVNSFTAIKDKIKEIFNNIPDYFKTKFSESLTKIKDAFNPIKEWFSGVWRKLKDIVSDTWDKILGLFNKGGKIFDGITEGIAGIFKRIVNSLISGINKVIATPFNLINGLLNKVREINIMGFSPFENLWDKDPLTVPQIPKLAQGGFVKANNPTLAMIGDNTRYGEIVAPENKLNQLLDKAINRSGINEDILYKAFLRALKDMPNQDINLNVDGVRLGNAVAKGVNKITKANGGICPIIT